MFCISRLKKGIIHIRTGMRLTILLAIALFIVTSAILIFYKPIYAVNYNGEFLGYVNSKGQLQTKINEYIKTGNGDNNVAFVQIEKMPQYDMCLLKRDMKTNDEEIYNKIVNTGVSYYKYYIILLNGESKYYLATYEEAESVINQLKEKNSNNINKISMVEKYDTNIVEFANVETCVNGLYEKKVVAVKKPTYSSSKNNGSIGSSKNVNSSSNKVNLGISLIQPVSGRISCRYGRRSGYYHTGLDIAAPNGTPIRAAAGGTVTYAGYHYSYGNLLIISHGNGIQTYYAHCSKLYVSNGQSVSQGQNIAAVGSTGNSTGNHLHLEVRVNGTAQNPQNYVY